MLALMSRRQGAAESDWEMSTSETLPVPGAMEELPLRAWDRRGIILQSSSPPGTPKWVGNPCQGAFLQKSWLPEF